MPRVNGILALAWAVQLVVLWSRRCKGTGQILWHPLSENVSQRVNCIRTQPPDVEPLEPGSVFHFPKALGPKENKARSSPRANKGFPPETDLCHIERDRDQDMQTGSAPDAALHGWHHHLFAVQPIRQSDREILLD